MVCSPYFKKNLYDDDLDCKVKIIYGYETELNENYYFFRQNYFQRWSFLDLMYWIVGKFQDQV